MMSPPKKKRKNKSDVKRGGDDDKLKLEIIKASNAIRKKHMALKLNRSQENAMLQKTFKPITEPLQNINVAIKDETKAIIEPLKDLSAKTESLEVPLRAIDMKIESIKQPLKELGESIRNMDASSITLSDSEMTEEEDLEPAAVVQPAHLQDVNLWDGLDPMPKEYVMGFSKDVDGTFDTTYGITFDPVKHKIKLGNCHVSFEGEDLVIGGKKFKGSRGLYELVFKKVPQGYTDSDLDLYGDIVLHTNIHRRKFDAGQQLRGNPSFKWSIISKVLELKQKKDGKYMKRKKKVSGRGMQLIADTKMPYQYVYWDDVNELVNRLRILIGSQNAGSTSHHNEIVSLIEELREAGVIE